MKTEQEFLEYMAVSLSEINENMDSSTISALHGSVVHRLNKLLDQPVKILPDPGTIIWVGGEGNPWMPRVFKEIRDGRAECYIDCQSSGETVPWDYWEHVNMTSRKLPGHKPGESDDA